MGKFICLGFVAVVLVGCFDVDADVDANTFVYTPVDADAPVNIGTSSADAGIDPDLTVNGPLMITVEAMPMLDNDPETIFVPGSKNVHMRRFVLRSENRLKLRTFTVDVLSNEGINSLEECRLHAWPKLMACMSATVRDTNGIAMTFEIDETKCVIEGSIVLDVDCDIADNAKDGQSYDIRFADGGQNEAVIGKNDTLAEFQGVASGVEMPLVVVTK